MKKSLLRMTLAALFLTSLISCASSSTFVVPPIPKLPTFSEQFNKNTPVSDLEKIRDHEMDWISVYQVMKKQMGK